MMYTAKATNGDKVFVKETDDVVSLLEWVESKCDLTFYDYSFNDIFNTSRFQLCVQGVGTNVVIVSDGFYSQKELKQYVLNKVMPHYSEKRSLTIV
jgi:hypothetical protein